VQAHAGAAHGLRGYRSELGKFIPHHDDGISNLDFRVHHFAAGIFGDSTLFRPECLLVEFDGSSTIFDCHEGSDGVIALRNGFYCHKCLLGWNFPKVYTSCEWKLSTRSISLRGDNMLSGVLWPLPATHDGMTMGGEDVQ
jgi:hypothetical protein